MKKDYLKSRHLCKVTFSLPKAAVKDAKSVLLLGDFNDWEESQAIALTEMTDGSFVTELELDTGREYEFRYLIDSERWENDWEADRYVPSPFLGVNNSVVILENVELTNGVQNGHASSPVVEKTPVKEEAKEAPVKEEKKPAKKAKVKKEDLKKIEGIGPKIAGLLEEAGINSWQKLSEASVEQIKEILVAAGSRYKAFDPTTWPKQAAMAAQGNWDELKKWQKELQGGKAKKAKK